MGVDRMSVSKDKKVKIGAIGAGSASFGNRILVGVLGSNELRNIDCTLALVDIDGKALERTRRVAVLLKEYYGLPVKVETTTDRCEALEGADYVTISVARKRNELWEQDFRVPLVYGFRHITGEMAGPGAVFHAMRSLELVMPICRDIERICPKALVFNYTNPLPSVVMAINHLTKVKAVGMCHGVFNTSLKISEILGRPLEDLSIVTGGINHLLWVLKIAETRTGKSLYPEMKRKVKENPSLLQPLASKMLEIFGYLTHPVDHHSGEHLAFAYEFTGLRWPYGRESRSVSDSDEAMNGGDWLESVIAGETPADEIIARISPHFDLSIPIICDIEFDRKMRRSSVNVLNDGG